jgi:hypothetical protein
MPPDYTDESAAQALVKVLGESRWLGVALAHGYIARLAGATDEEAARIVYDRNDVTLKRSRELIAAAMVNGFLAQLPPREKTGSAENAITKMFPATITEQRFLESLEDLVTARKSVTYKDEREVRHSLTDFRLLEGDADLPINIKNAGTRFANAKQLVGLDPDDCIPIPAYKANAAVEACPNLVYIVSADYDLVGRLADLLPKLLDDNEKVVWDLLQRYAGTHLKNAEDLFIFATVRKYWDTIKPIAADNPFHVISARKALRVLHTKPQRTPGIGLKAWGTGASAEVNVHVSIQQEMTAWPTVRDRILAKGVEDIVQAVNRKRVEEVYDPEI